MTIQADDATTDTNLLPELFKCRGGGDGGGVIFVDHALWSLVLLSLIGAPGRN